MPKQIFSRSGQQRHIGEKGKSNGHHIDWGQEDGDVEDTDTIGALSNPLGALPLDIEDEVSWVVHEFRQQSSPICALRGRKIETKTRKKTIHHGFFSDVRYCSNPSIAPGAAGKTRKRQRSGGGNIGSQNPPVFFESRHFVEATYLFDKVLLLSFHVYIRFLDHLDDGEKNVRSGQFESKNKSSYETMVLFVGGEDDVGCSISDCFTEDEWNVLKDSLVEICDALNRNNSEKTQSFSSSSLFAVLSKLLLSLNQLQTENIARKKSAKFLIRPLTDRQRSSHLENILGEDLSLIHPTDSPSNSCSAGGVDLAILLLRCAAVGKHQDIFSHPFPRPAEGGPIAPTIWKSTEFHQRFQRRRRLRYMESIETHSSTKPKTKFNAVTAHAPEKNKLKALVESQLLLHSSEQQLLGFICSLPWMKRGRITVTKTQRSFEKDGTFTRDEGRKLFEMCLCLDASDEDPIIGDTSYSPRFARCCQEHGVLTVYHGTQMENAWSILNNGFWNLSEVGNNEFVKNGAMLGSGVYLTTSKKVATFFATSNTTGRTVRAALKHDSVFRLLSRVGDYEPELDAKHMSDGEMDRQKLEGGTSTFHELYEVSCYAVFEARIVRPPEHRGHDTSTSSPIHQRKQQDNIVRTNNCSSSTRRDGKYYVVPDGRDIRITKLHLTFELKRRTRVTTKLLLSNFLPTLLLVPSARANSSIVIAVFGLILSVYYLWCYASTSV